MHKDPKPGLFDFAGHSIRYTVSLGMLSGFVLSIFVYAGLSVWRADTGRGEAGKNTAALEASMAARRRGTPTPAPTASMRY